MASTSYNRQVVWKSPFIDHFLPLGSYGMQYTKVAIDIPLENMRHEIWDITDTLFVGEADTDQYITFQTTLPYFSGTLEVYADGELADYTESRRRIKRSFELDKQKAKNKHMWMTYIPNSLSYAIGNNKQRLEDVYGIKCAVLYSNKLRETIKLARKYVSSISTYLGIEPPLWIGGRGNTERSTEDNLLPTLTPISAELHLVPINEHIVIIQDTLIGEGYQNIPLLLDAEFSIEYFEQLQIVLNTIDEIMENRE